MKLELKHLAFYLPYRLQMYCETMNGCETFQWTLQTNNIDDALGFQNKPILRPLSDLTKEIEMPFGKIVPMEWMFKDLWLDWDGESNCNTTMKNTYNCSNSKVLPEFLPQFIFNQLLEMHFDVFGLIEKRLAMDINKK